MARGLNKVTLIGNVGQDPETRHMPSGGQVTNVSLATNEQWKGQDGEKHEKVEWHRLVFFGKLAEIAGEYLTKGKQCYVEGRLQTRKWQDQSGNDRWSTEIVVSQMLLLGGGGQEGGAGRRQRDDGGAGDYERESGGRSGGQGRRQEPPKSNPPTDFDDDIPF